MKKRVLALALAGCLLFGAVGCQGEQEEIYSQAMGESSASQEEAQESGEELSGELTIPLCVRFRPGPDREAV